MAVPVKFFEDGRTEPRQKEPLIRVLSDPDQRRVCKRRDTGDKPFWFGRFRYHGNIGPQCHQGIDLAMQCHSTVPRNYTHRRCRITPDPMASESRPTVGFVMGVISDGAQAAVQHLCFGSMYRTRAGQVIGRGAFGELERLFLLRI